MRGDGTRACSRQAGFPECPGAWNRQPFYVAQVEGIVELMGEEAFRAKLRVIARQKPKEEGKSEEPKVSRRSRR